VDDVVVESDCYVGGGLVIPPPANHAMKAQSITHLLSPHAVSYFKHG